MSDGLSFFGWLTKPEIMMTGLEGEIKLFLHPITVGV